MEMSGHTSSEVSCLKGRRILENRYSLKITAMRTRIQRSRDQCCDPAGYRSGQLKSPKAAERKKAVHSGRTWLAYGVVRFTPGVKDVENKLVIPEDCLSWSGRVMECPPRIWL